MAIEDIIEEIRSTALDEAARIRREAEREAAAIIKEAEVSGARSMDAEMADAKRDADMILNTFESQARLKAKQAHLEAREKLIEESLDRCREILTGDDPPRYKAFVRQSVEMGVISLGTPLTVELVRDTDADIVKDIPGIKVDTSARKDDPSKPLKDRDLGGVVLRSGDGRSMDMTLRGLMERREHEVRTAAARALFDEDGAQEPTRKDR